MDEYTFAAQSYNKGYKDSKTAARAELLEVLEEIEDLVDTSYEAAKKKHAEFSSGSDTNVYWTGRFVSYGEMLKAIQELKNKYQENKDVQ